MNSGCIRGREPGVKSDNTASRAEALSAPAALLRTFAQSSGPMGRGGQGLIVPCWPSDLRCLRVCHQKEVKLSGVTVDILKL